MYHKTIFMEAEITNRPELLSHEFVAEGDQSAK